MPRQLLVLRHAKSSWTSNAPNGFERPLAQRGQNDAPRMGKWLLRAGLVPEYVVSSPAARARETARMACEAMNVGKDHVVWDVRIYDASLSGLLDVLADIPADTARVMLVGHNPGLESLVRHLGGDAVEEPPDGKLLPTAAVACLDMRDPWSRLAEGSGRLLFITRPKALEL